MMENNIKKDFIWNTSGSLMYALTSLVFMIIATRAVGADGSTKRVVENRRVNSLIINRLISTSFKMELLIYAEDDSVC